MTCQHHVDFAHAQISFSKSAKIFHLVPVFCSLQISMLYHGIFGLKKEEDKKSSSYMIAYMLSVKFSFISSVKKGK